MCQRSSNPVPLGQRSYALPQGHTGLKSVRIHHKEKKGLVIEEQKDQKQGDEHVEILEQKEGDGKEQEVGLRGETGGSL